MAGPLDVPGNAMLSVAAYQKRMIKLGEALMRLEATLERLYDEDILILGLSVKFPNEEGADYFMTVRAQVDGELKVAFHGAATFAESVEGFVNRLVRKQLRWKADKYAGN